MKSAAMFLVTVALFVGAAGVSMAQEETQAVKQQEKTFTKRLELSYLLFLPSDYDAASDKTWPLIVFLHGAGERGSDLQKVKVHGIPKVAEQQADFPFIAVSPQCPVETWWGQHVDALNGLLDETLANYKVDERRVYLTGLSMGGYGTWAWSTAYPERFAAIAPVCGGGNPAKAVALRNMPTWVFHGARDTVVPLKRSQEMVDAMKVAGGDPKLTVYPDAGHDSWTESYANAKLYEWFLQHQLPADKED